MNPFTTGPIYTLDRLRRDRLGRLVRIDPVGPMVAAHAVLLASLGSVQNASGVLLLAVAVLAWRTILTVLANRARSSLRPHLYIVRAIGSLAIVGWMMVLDGGTESPLFFSMLVVVVWAAAMNSLKGFFEIGIGALIVYLGVILVVPDITVNSLARLGVYVFFLGLLAWARAVSDYWMQESQSAKALATEILERVPTGFALYETGDLGCLFTNRGASDLGLDSPDEVLLDRYGTSDGSMTLRELLASVAVSGEPLAPTLYVMSIGEPDERFLRLGMTHRAVTDQDGLILVSSEDVSAQVASGEQQRRFFEAANHQFRTPLSPIMAYADLITQGSLTPEQLHEAGAAIGEGAQRLETLLDRISELLRLQRRPNRARVEVTVEELVEGRVLDAAPQLRGSLHLVRGASLVVRCEPEPAARALVELALNGKRHGVTPVSISAEASDDAIVLSLFDEGPGPDLDPKAPLDHSWGLLAHPEVMPPEMGQRLGISYAFTLTQTAGGALDFSRDGASWEFMLKFPSASTPVSVEPVASTIL